MSEFIILEDTISERIVKEKKIARKKEELFNSLPSMSGVFIIEFPNQKKFVGAASDVKEKIKSLLSILIVSDKTKYLRKTKDWKPSAKWIKECLMENDLKSFEDLKINWVVCEDWIKGLEIYLSRIEDKEQYYNKFSSC